MTSKRTQHSVESKGDENQFLTEEVTRAIKDLVENTIGGKTYSDKMINAWTSEIVDNSLILLVRDQKPFKYVVTVMIMQKNGSGLHSSSSCYWNNDTDGTCTVRWENRTMYCIVSVFGLAI